MTWQYIAGFFDADGSVTMIRQKKTENRSMCLYFTNTDKAILEEIERFLTKECGVKGYYFSPKKVKDHHIQGYDLRYQRNSALVMGKELLKYIKHSKKTQRLGIIYNEFRPLIKSNGKYSIKEKDELEQIAQKILDIK